MKKIYKVMQQVKISNNKWLDVSIFNQFVYCEPIKIEKTYNTFNELLNGVKNTEIINGWIDYTIFKHTPKVCLSVAWRDLCYVLTAKKFKTVKTRLIYKEWNNYTLADVIKLLPSEDAIEYLKNNGIIFENSIDKLKEI